MCFARICVLKGIHYTYPPPSHTYTLLLLAPPPPPHPHPPKRGKNSCNDLKGSADSARTWWEKSQCFHIVITPMYINTQCCRQNRKKRRRRKKKKKEMQANTQKSCTQASQNVYINARGQMLQFFILSR